MNNEASPAGRRGNWSWRSWTPFSIFTSIIFIFICTRTCRTWAASFLLPNKKQLQVKFKHINHMMNHNTLSLESQLHLDFWHFEPLWDALMLPPVSLHHQGLCSLLPGICLFVCACPFDPSCQILSSQTGQRSSLHFLSVYKQQRGALVSFYLMPRSAGLFGLEVEKWREEGEPRTMLTHKVLVPTASGNPEKWNTALCYVM